MAGVGARQLAAAGVSAPAKSAELVALLRARGIPASEVANPDRLLQTNPQLRARRYFDTPAHPVVGAMPLPTLPYRFECIERWLQTHAPTLGQHNGAVLRTLLGLSPEALRQLEAEGVIGTRPARL